MTQKDSNLQDPAAFPILKLSAGATEKALDGSSVRPLIRLPVGSMAHITMAPGQVSIAIAHRTITEIWYFLAGVGRIWRRTGELEQTDNVEPGVCLSVSLGTHFQFRNDGETPLVFLVATTPPWPGNAEAFIVEGPWQPTYPPI